MSKVFIMWIQMKEKAPFRVVEMGAGPDASGMIDFT
jgi:SAM-dependent MidA family methyltransferase